MGVQDSQADVHRCARLLHWDRKTWVGPLCELSLRHIHVGSGQCCAASFLQGCNYWAQCRSHSHPHLLSVHTPGCVQSPGRSSTCWKHCFGGRWSGWRLPFGLRQYDEGADCGRAAHESHIPQSGPPFNGVVARITTCQTGSHCHVTRCGWLACSSVSVSI